MKIKSREFIVLSASSMLLTALGIDIMLPVFTAVRSYYGLPETSTATANIVMFFFMGQVTQLYFGAMSDRYGRVPVLRIGLFMYIVGGIAATFAPNLIMMYAARFIAGAGAAGVFTTIVAGVRDRFSGDQMARIMSFIFTIFLFTPVIAPFLGEAILMAANWQTVFITPPFFALIVLFWTFRLEESHPPENRSVHAFKGIAKPIRKILSNQGFLKYTAITTFLFAGFSSYIASSEHIISEIYGKPGLFKWIFGGIGLLMALFTFINAKISSKYGAKTTLKNLVIAYSLISALILVLYILNDSLSLWVLFGMVALLVSINLAIEPNSSALAMNSLGDSAGIASALYGTSYFFIGSALGTIITSFMKQNIMALVISFFVIGIISLTLVYLKDLKFDKQI